MIPFLSDKTVLLRQIPIFGDLNFFERRLVLEACEVLDIKRGQFIYREGDAPDAFYAVLSGRVQLFVDHAGQPEPLEVLHRGKFFGFISLLTGDPHSVTASAATDAVLIRLPKISFDHILKSIPRLGVELSRTLSRRLKRKDAHPKSIFESTIIAVTGAPETLAETSLYALNFALGLADQTAKKVILIDPDDPGSVIPGLLGMSLDDVMAMPSRFATMEEVNRSIIRHASGLHVLRVRRPADDAVDPASFISLLTLLINDYHYCVLRQSPASGEKEARILLQADVVHILSQPDSGHLKAMVRSFHDLGVWNDPDFKRKSRLILFEQENVHGGGRNVSREAPESIFFQPVFATLPYVASQHRTILDKTYRDPYARVIRRIARQTGEVLVGLALGSGSAMGISHIGVLKVLERESVEIDMVSGTSIGALIAALWCAGYSAGEVERIILESRGRKYIFGWDDLTFPLRGLIKGKHVLKFLDRTLGQMTFKDLKRPLRIVACDAVTMKRVVFDSGRVKDAVMASLSIPGVFVPYQIGARSYIDGGILDPLPTDVLVANGAKKVIAVNVLPSADELERTYELDQEQRLKNECAWPVFGKLRRFWRERLHRLFTPNIFGIIVASIQTLEYLLAQTSAASRSDVVLHPDVTAVSWSDFENIQDLIRRGEEEAERRLWELQDLIRRPA